MSRVALMAATLLLSGTVRAAECPLPVGAAPTLADASPEARLGFIREHLLHDGQNVLRWRIAWASGYSAILVTELALIPVLHGHARSELYVGAGSATLGILTSVFTPLHSRPDGLSLNLQLAQPPEDVCSAVAHAEQLLERSAHDERFEHSALPHIGNVMFNLGLGLLIGLGFHDWKGAAISMSAGIPIGEVMILTSPLGAAEALTRYRAGDLTGPKVQLRVQGTSLALTF